ncbi:hypothetical protein F8A10_02560 [Paracoccus kondratievae]|uniref:Uncharacterized protein n=1 Tax=Paracoccus kondratievae TaxID=135740 RepID=A0AAD3P2P6_9RHOB|nr:MULTISPECIES: hypothetical protein [Paracoccus]QFQ86413.1 hypothetical protein F8A10_02560 [Paracoccus kondratievae]GLK65750.1 hypothetical protein GCM10017635_32270 [Paracoccus kondratievae]
MNRIGLTLMAAAAAAMIAADAFAGEPSQPFAPTAEKFYLKFSVFAPADIRCDATGPGVRTKVSRSVTGAPLLRITGNASDAQIQCWRPDGSRYTTDVNRKVSYNAAGAVWATVMLQTGGDAASVMVERDGEQDRLVPTIYSGAFVKVRE